DVALVFRIAFLGAGGLRRNRRLRHRPAKRRILLLGAALALGFGGGHLQRVDLARRLGIARRATHPPRADEVAEALVVFASRLVIAFAVHVVLLGHPSTPESWSELCGAEGGRSVGSRRKDLSGRSKSRRPRLSYSEPV